MTTQHNNKSSEVSRIGRFGLVGILNTLVDFISNNILIIVFSIGLVPAGIISGTLAMINSFIFNQRFTFRARNVSAKRVIAFFVITAFGLFVIRPLVLTLFTNTWLWPSEILYEVTSVLNLPFSKEFDTNNLALAAAIFVVLFYNYFMYKKFVFVKKS